MLFSDIDKTWMQRALKEASKSAEIGEVPVGAVMTDGSKLVCGRGNSPISSLDPTAHAEIKVLREAALQLQNYRLTGTTLYVTLEPCIMCMGAIIHARVERLVFGAYDPKSGAATSLYQVGSDQRLNHDLVIQGGLLEDDCGQMLTDFFRQKRGRS
jgi:tRNA(adenine34) deaminase